MTLLNRFRRLVRRRGPSNTGKPATRNAATQTLPNLTNQQRLNLLKAYNNAVTPPPSKTKRKITTIGNLLGTPSPGTPNVAPRAAAYAPTRLPRAPTQNYIAELQKLARSVKHAEGRAKLQLKRLKERPNLEGSVRRAQLDVERARQITAAVNQQLANALAGRWVEHAISYRGPGSWSFVPGLDRLTERVTARVARRNQQLGGRPTLNWYDVKHANQLNRAKAALNALITGSRLVSQNEVRLLQGQLKRVADKKRRQGLVFNWEQRLLDSRDLVRHSRYAGPNQKFKLSNFLRNQRYGMYENTMAANTKLKRGQRLNQRDVELLEGYDRTQKGMLRLLGGGRP